MTIHDAARTGDVHAVKVALGRRVRVDVQDEAGFAPLHWAALQGHANVVRLLLQKGADPDASTPAGITALHWAAFGGHLEVAELLLAGRASPEAATTEGLTPFDWAVRQGQKAVAKVLREHGDTTVEVSPYPGGVEHDFALGKHYSRDEIHCALGGGMRDYLPHKDGRVVCGAFTALLNPHVPDVVVVGPAPQVRHWAGVFCEQRYPVPVFMKVAPTHWKFVGDYQVERWTENRREIAKHEAISGRDEVVRIMFLRRVR